MRTILILFLLSIWVFSGTAQTTITLQPGAATGEDAFVEDIYPTGNFGAHVDYAAIAWTNNSVPATVRSFLNFDLSAVPSGATITSAALSLYHNPTSPNTGHSSLSGSNSSTLYRIISSWSESTVTWNTQPSYTTQNAVQLAASSSSTQDYLNINVTALVQDMVNDPSNSFGFMLKLDNESYYRSMVFASSDNSNASLHPMLVITYTMSAQNCVTLQPDASNGEDAFVEDIYPNGNFGAHVDYAAIAWTNNSVPAVVRSLLNFDLSAVPSGATITSAALSLYHNPTSPNTGHSSLSGSNSATLYRIISSWTENIVTWNMQPSYSIQNAVQLAASTSSTQDYLNINVLGLVQDMVNDPSNSFGFLLKLDNESYYRSMIFASSDNSNAALHPKLVVCYTTGTGINESVEIGSLLVYPNPSAGAITFQYNLPARSEVSLAIYDVTGRLIAMPVIGQEQVGAQVIKMDGGELGLSPGVYLARLDAGAYHTTKTFIIE